MHGTDGVADGTGFIRASARGAFGHAGFGIASALFAGAAAAQDSAITLPQIEVTGIDSGGYQRTQPSLSRLPTPLRDTPQSVTVIPQQVLREQNVASVREALRNVSGITVNAGEGGNQGDAITLRGFNARGDFYRDGIRDPGWYTRDSFSVEDIEVLKGPSSILFGRGSTGGVINLVSKLPKKVPAFVEFDAQANTGPGARVVLDANGQVAENVTARIVAMGQRFDAVDRDNVEQNRWGIAPSLAVDLTDRTKLTLSYIYQKEAGVPDFGIPFLPGSYVGRPFGVPARAVPRSNWYGIRGDVEDTSAHIATARLEHAFSDDVKIANTTRYSNVDRFVRVTNPGQLQPSPLGPTTPLSAITVGRSRFQNETENTLLTNQTDLVAKFETGPLRHTLAAGFELTRETRDNVRFNVNAPAASRANLLFPLPAIEPGGLQTVPPVPQSIVADTVAVYAADQVKINDYIEVLGGIRFDNFTADYQALPLSVSSKDRVTSWRTGVVVHPTRFSSVYAMYGTSFNPSAEFGTLSALNTNLEPEKNTTLEVGAKVDVLDERLSLTAAVFSTEKENARVSDPLDPLGTIVLAGKQEVAGFELGAVGNITERWKVLANFTHLDTEFVESRNPDEVGKELPSAAPNSFALFTTYALTDQFTVGGGAYYVDAQFLNTTNTFQAPAYWRFDAFASYRWRNVIVQLNVNNIFDEYYFAELYQGGRGVPGAGRSATLSARALF